MLIFFTGGGTLGSVTPLLAVADAIRKTRPDVKFAWIGTAAGPEKTLVNEAGIDFYSISAGKLRRYFSLRNVSDLFLVLKGFWQAYRLLGSLKPDVIVSAGGFVAVPVVWVAAARKIPVHIHQQDIRPGLANRLSSSFASSVSVAFQKSIKDFADRYPVWTGNPVRAELFSGSRQEAQKLFSLEEGAPTLLALGGGTGAERLNELVSAAAPAVVSAAQFIHLVGRGKRKGKFIHPRYHEIEFLSGDMRHAYAAADLVITRAGMGALTELAALGKPAIVVPIAGTHQEENARLFADSGACPLIDERRIKSDELAKIVLALLQDEQKRAKMSEAMRGMSKPDAAEKVAQMVLHLVRS